MERIQLNKNQLTLTVKKGPVFIRYFILLFAVICILLPITGLVLSMLVGDGFHFGFLFGIAIFGLLGSYMLKIFLWNSFGKEIISFNENSVEYSVDYRWFKSEKSFPATSGLFFIINSVGYEEDKQGVLVIKSNDSILETATRFHLDDLKILVDQLNASFKR